MNPGPRHSSSLATHASWAGLGLLALGVVVGGAVALETAGTLAVEHPEFRHVQGPLLAAVLAFGVCVEAVLLVTALIVGAIHDGSIVRQPASRLVDVLAAALTGATLVAVATLPFLPGPPALVLAVLGVALAATTATLLVLVLRSWLRRAAAGRLDPARGPSESRAGSGVD
ncbi:DUF2975 family protein [Frigoribacterium sp. PhB160]|uniref:DUF2975 domain-containing protein n=1 Tax=Frigoribacterium sp. PhB160 TaxID=2485192 RepID=UPI000F4862CB|nr:DUF2975 domain-containing protein [Frigoribacterium sp. PhB160]ROS59199.1 DUF2975 family protein [Frigoribacterium sp. PhB160]